MPAYKPVRSPLVSMGPSLEEERRRSRSARLVALATVAAVSAIVVLVWFVGLLGREVVRDGAADAGLTGATRASATPVLPAGPPDPQRLASVVVERNEPGLELQVPIRKEAITGIGFGPRHERDVLELEPAGRRANLAWGKRLVERFLATSPPGDLVWFRLGDGTPSMATVGAAPHTDVYAPIDATVVAINELVVDGERRGDIVQLQPLGDAQTLVVVRGLDPVEGLAVGQKVVNGSDQIGTVHPVPASATMPLAAYTHDSGSGVDLYVRRAALGSTVGL